MYLRIEVECDSYSVFSLIGIGMIELFHQPLACIKTECVRIRNEFSTLIFVKKLQNMN